MKLVICFMALALSAGGASAVDLKWPDGTVWHDIRYVSWSETTITLAHDGNESSVPIKTLPEELRIEVLMSRASASRLALEADPTFAELKTQGVHFFGKWNQIVSKHSAFAEGQIQWKEEVISVAIVGGIAGDAVDGAKWDGWLWPAGRSQYTDVLGSRRTVQRFATSPELALTLERVDAAN